MAYPYDDPEQALIADYIRNNQALADVGVMGAGMLPGASLLDAMGQMPAVGGGMSPSMMSNIQGGNYLDALLQGTGSVGDMMMATGALAPAGAALKGLAAAGKGAKAASKTGKTARMSKAEAEAAGYWHPIGAGKKLPVPVGEMKAEREVIANLPERLSANPEKMVGGAIVPFHGDRSIAGQNLLGVGEVRFENPVYLEGGYDFMRTHSPYGSIWASNQGAAQGLLNRINDAEKMYKGDVYGVYSAMGPESMNFNVMMADALLEQMKAGNISKKAVKAFDKEVKSLRPEWKGIMNPESRAQLEENGALRQAFVNRMQLDKFQEAGFPDISYTRHAITDPRLLDEPMYSSGLSIGKMQPGSDLVLDAPYPHKTYDAQLRGEYVGGFDQSVPKEIMYPDFFKGRRAEGRPLSGDVRSFQLANPIQQTNQEWLDGLMKYLEESQKPLGY